MNDTLIFRINVTQVASIGDTPDTIHLYFRRNGKFSTNLSPILCTAVGVNKNVNRDLRNHEKLRVLLVMWFNLIPSCAVSEARECTQMSNDGIENIALERE